METERIVIPRVPQEIVDEILDHLTTDPDHRSLQSSALVSKSWVPSCRRHLFHTTIFTPKNAARWVKTFPVPERSPACYVRDLRFLAEGSDTIFELKFFEHVPWFTNAEKMSLSGDGHLRLMRFPLSCGLPQSVASLTIDGGAVFLGHIRGIMAQLPNLNDLSLAGNIVPGDRRALLGIGKVLRGRFGGKLRLHRGRSYEDTVNMMLEIPTGLHFTEVEIRAKYGCPSAMRLAEACSKTLTRLTYTADFNYGNKSLERSLDFSKLPNLQEVYLGVGWMSEDLPWIPAALSTIKPATSPRLSVIKLKSPRQPNANGSVEVMTRDTGNDSRKVVDEVTRIEREFGGTLSSTVLRYAAFEVVLHTLDIHWH